MLLRFRAAKSLDSNAMNTCKTSQVMFSFKNTKLRIKLSLTQFLSHTGLKLKMSLMSHALQVKDPLFLQLSVNNPEKQQRIRSILRPTSLRKQCRQEKTKRNRWIRTRRQKEKFILTSLKRIRPTMLKLRRNLMLTIKSGNSFKAIAQRLKLRTIKLLTWCQRRMLRLFKTI